ncbi:MAG: glycosyltransferase family 4 protein [Thermoanaerobaculia bacterium]
MRVLIDGRPLVGERTGIGVHTAEIAGRLDIEPAPVIASHAPIADRGGIERCTFRVDRAPFGVFWQQFLLPRIEADVLWGPHGTLPLAWKKPSVVTMHDLTSITMPGAHRLKTILSFNTFISQSLDHATRIAAVSRIVADEVMRGFAVPARKIEIVPNGVDEFFSPDGGPEGDYILFVGTIEPRKGVDDLVDVWRSLPEPRPRLVLCGARGWGMRLPQHEGLEISGYVDRATLRDLYRRARLFVYPSRHEGFGIPPLEAMSCGAPVIATRTGAIAEFAGDAALLVPPRDFTALREGIARALGDDALRRELRARGPERASRFRWESSAAIMRELLHRAAR